MYITPSLNLIKSQGQRQFSTTLHRLIPTLSNTTNLLSTSSNSPIKIINNGRLNTINIKNFYSSVPNKK